MSYSKKVQEARMSYTFDDFLLTPNASYVEPKDIDTTVELGKGIKLNIPVLSAAMDTVTEADLAIAMAQQGGVGVIHRNISLERQVEEVKKVKNAEDLTIRDVITISPDSTVSEAQSLMRNELISGLPVVDSDKIMGIISKRDIRPFLKSQPSTAPLKSSAIFHIVLCSSALSCSFFIFIFALPFPNIYIFIYIIKLIFSQ